MEIPDDLMSFARDKNIVLKPQSEIAIIAAKNIREKYDQSNIKNNFDELIYETESETYQIYLEEEAEFGRKVIEGYIEYLESSGVSEAQNLKVLLGQSFRLFDRFFLSIAQSRRTRAGRTFENIQNALFKQLSYPFDEQIVINGKPDFLMPSAKHYTRDPLDCIIFTAKRTLRERWRQIVTEGTRGYGFFLATLDDSITGSQLTEMHHNKIYVVCPKVIKAAKYPDKVNVLSYEQFFKDHLDPSMERWKRNGII